MLVAWSEHVQIKMMRNNDFCMEMQIAPDDEKDSFGEIFVHTSTYSKERQRQ